MNKIASMLVLAIVIAFTTLITSTSALRGSVNHEVQQQVQQQRNVTTRHLLEDDIECTIYVKITSFPDNTDEISYSCEFPLKMAKERFNGRDIMNIFGVSKEDMDALNPVSGESILRTTGAVVLQYLDSAAAALNGGEDIQLVVTSDIIIEPITEDDVRHHRYHKNRRRLSKTNTGVLKTLVVRPISPNGAAVDATAAKLRNDVFEDEVCLKRQMEACSFNQLEIQPANVGDGGVVDVAIDVNPIPDDTRDGNRGQLAQRASAQTNELYGGEDGLGAEFDLVIFCQPPGSGGWDAFAYLNRYDSYYNKNRCSISGVLMHEVGHNFGLSHSGTGGGNVYGDLTGYMSAGSTEDDGPKKCFNAVKNYRLGWYNLQIGSTDPLDFIGKPTSFVLNGVADYKKDGSSKGELISLRLEQFGEDYGVDFYLGYNRKAGVNSGVPTGGDKVVLYSKDRGINSALSARIVMLDIGESYTIDDYRGNGSTVTIKFDKLSSDMKDATITLSATPPPPTASPTISCGGFGRFKVEIGSDNFAGDTSWKLVENNTNNLVAEGDKKNYKDNKSVLEPTDGTAFCLDPGSCYDFKIYDSYGDGLKPNQNGFYRGFLGTASGGDEYRKVFEGGVFSSEDTRTFCVDDISPSTPTIPPTIPPKPPTPVPTAFPTKIPPTMAPVAPTIGPTSECSDDDGLRYKSVKRCNWVGAGTDRCEIEWLGKLLKEYCPITCGVCQPGTPPPPVTSQTKSPTKSPTNSPTNVVSIDDGKCENDPDFKYQGSKTCTQGWIEQEGDDRRCNLNAKDTLAPDKLIKDFCPITCGVCQPGTPPPPPPPVTSPTKSPTNPPTNVVSIDNGKCENDPDFKYQGSKTCTQGWIEQEGDDRRCNLNAKDTLAPDKLIKDFCPITCGVCQPGTPPPPPPVTSPTKSPTNPPTNVVSIDNGKCENDPDFKYQGVKTCTQGWIEQEGEFERRCNLNAMESLAPDKLIKDFCPVTCGVCDPIKNNETELTPEELSSPPSTCGEDDSDFRFKGKKKKDCEWLGNYRKGRKMCKKKKQDKIKLHKLCSHTCGLKFGIGQCKGLKK